jgi:hypothetical protein
VLIVAHYRNHLGRRSSCLIVFLIVDGITGQVVCIHLLRQTVERRHDSRARATSSWEGANGREICRPRRGSRRRAWPKPIHPPAAIRDPFSALGERPGAGEFNADERLITYYTGVVPRRYRV